MSEEPERGAQGADAAPRAVDDGPRLRRTLGLADLVLYGIVVVQPTAPMPIFGVVTQEARGHVTSAVLLAMAAMLLTALSYGRMARAHPSAGSAFTYVGRELHPALGTITGWAMALDYLLNPLICAVWCGQAAANIAPTVPRAAWGAAFALLFTALNLRGVRASARLNAVLAAALGAVIALFLVYAARAVSAAPHPAGFFTRPLYDPTTFSPGALFTGTSVAVLTYIGFDGISTLAEEARDPRRDILRATVLTCLVTGVLAAVEVYAAQLVWPAGERFPDVDTAFVHVAGRAGGRWLFHVVNAALLVATVGSGVGAQLAAARLLYGMGQADVLPRAFFGAVEPRRGVPRNNVLLLGALALGGTFLISYQLGAELLNCGAFVAFLGVNAAAFVHAFRAGRRGVAALAPPALGFAICAFIWLNLRWPAMVGGAAWLLLGALVAVLRGRGLRR